MTGAPQPPPAGPLQPAAPQPGNGLAVAGMVLGIISVGTSWFPCLMGVGIVCGVVGLILSILGLNKAKQLNGLGAGKAKGGLICSIVGIAIGIGVLLVLNLLLKGAGWHFGRFAKEMQKAVETYSNSR